MDQCHWQQQLKQKLLVGNQVGVTLEEPVPAVRPFVRNKSGNPFNALLVDKLLREEDKVDRTKSKSFVRIASDDIIFG